MKRYAVAAGIALLLLLTAFAPQARAVEDSVIILDESVITATSVADK